MTTRNFAIFAEYGREKLGHELFFKRPATAFEIDAANPSACKTGAKIRWWQERLLMRNQLQRLVARRQPLGSGILCLLTETAPDYFLASTSAMLP